MAGVSMEEADSVKYGAAALLQPGDEIDHKTSGIVGVGAGAGHDVEAPSNSGGTAARDGAGIGAKDGGEVDSQDAAETGAKAAD